jgi:hypothetical protein
MDEEHRNYYAQVRLSDIRERLRDTAEILVSAQPVTPPFSYTRIPVVPDLPLAQAEPGVGRHEATPGIPVINRGNSECDYRGWKELLGGQDNEHFVRKSRYFQTESADIESDPELFYNGDQILVDAYGHPLAGGEPKRPTYVGMVIPQSFQVTWQEVKDDQGRVVRDADGSVVYRWAPAVEINEQSVARAVQLPQYPQDFFLERLQGVPSTLEGTVNIAHFHSDNINVIIERREDSQKKLIGVLVNVVHAPASFTGVDYAAVLPVKGRRFNNIEVGLIWEDVSHPLLSNPLVHNNRTKGPCWGPAGGKSSEISSGAFCNPIQTAINEFIEEATNFFDVVNPYYDVRDWNWELRPRRGHEDRLQAILDSFGDFASYRQIRQLKDHVIQPITLDFGFNRILVWTDDLVGHYIEVFRRVLSSFRKIATVNGTPRAFFILDMNVLERQILDVDINGSKIISPYRGYNGNLNARPVRGMQTSYYGYARAVEWFKGRIGPDRPQPFYSIGGWNLRRNMEVVGEILNKYIA